MEKFQVLEISEVLRHRIGIYSWHLTHPNHRFFKSKSTYWVLFFLISGFITSSSLFVMKNTANLGVQLQTTIVVIAGFQCSGMILGVGCNMEEVRKLHCMLQEIVDKADGDIFNNYWKIEEKCRKYTSMISRYVHCEQFIYVSALVKSILSICMGDFDASAWNLPYSMVVPFHKTTLLGWYLLWFIQCNMGFSYTSSMVPVTAYFVCCCTYVNGICEHFELLIKSTWSDAEQYHDEKNPIVRNILYQKLRKTLCESIAAHINLYDVFEMTATINSATIFALLPINGIFLAITMYNIERSEFDAVAVSFNMLCLICLSWPTLYCYFASFTIERIAAIGKDVYCLKWYNHPTVLQKYFILIIARSQGNVQFTGLGLIYCSIETFGKLFQSACSYYLIFRSLVEM